MDLDVRPGEIVGIALQEAVLFKGDVRFNLKFPHPDAEDYVMFDAAKAADSWGFHLPTPEGRGGEAHRRHRIPKSDPPLVRDSGPARRSR